MSPRLGAAVFVALALTAVGCGGAATGTGTTETRPAPTATVTSEDTVGSSMDRPTGSTVRPAASTTTTDPAPSTAPSATPLGSLVTVTVGEIARGNQILMIGDSILAATASRFGGAMCRELVPLGWQVLLEAEVSRPVDFAAEVQREVDELLPSVEWDAGLIFLGTNFSGQASSYLRKLDTAVESFGDVPVVLVTLTEYDDRIPAANRAIETVARQRANVSVIDWRTVTADQPQLLFRDGIHPTDRGRAVLIGLISERLGQAPVRPGRCLPSTFVDDPRLPDGVMPSTTIAPAIGSSTTTSPNAVPTTTLPTTALPTTTLPTTAPTTAPASATSVAVGTNVAAPAMATPPAGMPVPVAASGG